MMNGLDVLDVIVRPMQQKDISQAVKIEQTCFTDPWTEHVYREEFASSGENLWLFAAVSAENDDVILGTISLTRMGDDGEIGNVAVLPEYRRQGIAGKLLDKVIRFGKSQLGMKNFTLEVRAGNEAAIRLYEKKGFRTEGIRPGMYENPREDAKIFWLRCMYD